MRRDEGVEAEAAGPGAQPRQFRASAVLVICAIFLVGVAVGAGGLYLLGGVAATNDALERAEGELVDALLQSDASLEEARAAKAALAILEEEHRALKSEVDWASSAGPQEVLTTISEGVYLVGTDMAPGQYKGRSTGWVGAYWAVSSDQHGSDIIANGNTDGQFYFTADVGQYVELQRGTATKID